MKFCPGSPPASPRWRMEYLMAVDARSQRRAAQTPTASFASDGTPNSSDRRIVSPSPSHLFATSHAASDCWPRLRRRSVLRYRPTLTSAQTAVPHPPIERAVSAVAVAITSSFAPQYSAAKSRLQTHAQTLPARPSWAASLGRTARARAPNHRLEHVSPRRDLPVAIVGDAVKPFHDRVNHHVSRTGIERDHLLRLGAPAGIIVKFAIPPMFCAIRPIRASAIQKVVKKRNQRRALATGGHVCRTKI